MKDNVQRNIQKEAKSETRGPSNPDGCATRAELIEATTTSMLTAMESDLLLADAVESTRDAVATTRADIEKIQRRLRIAFFALAAAADAGPRFVTLLSAGNAEGDVGESDEAQQRGFELMSEAAARL